MIKGDGCSGKTLLQGANCYFTVRFSPETSGVFNSINIPSNDPAKGHVTITLSGTGIFTDTNPGGGKSGCFIATAAYGSQYEAPVTWLRGFRDGWLLTNAPGRAFVKFYYKVSPPIADFIRENEFLKFIVRVALIPPVAVSYLLVKASAVTQITVSVLGLAFIAFFAARTYRRRETARD